jgi:hypothetical protein
MKSQLVQFIQYLLESSGKADYFAKPPDIELIRKIIIEERNSDFHDYSTILDLVTSYNRKNLV